ncbi:MAG: hypothetical protein RR014_03400, partial [Bilophila sp.]
FQFVGPGFKQNVGLCHSASGVVCNLVCAVIVEKECFFQNPCRIAATTAFVSAELLGLFIRTKHEGERQISSMPGKAFA